MDERLRELGRRWRLGDFDAGGAFLRERVRAGVIPESHVMFLALLGHEVCRKAVGMGSTSQGTYRDQDTLVESLEAWRVGQRSVSEPRSWLAILWALAIGDLAIPQLVGTRFESYADSTIERAVEYLRERTSEAAQAARHHGWALANVLDLPVAERTLALARSVSIAGLAASPGDPLPYFLIDVSEGLRAMDRGGRIMAAREITLAAWSHRGFATTAHRTWKRGLLEANARVASWLEPHLLYPERPGRFEVLWR